MPDVAQIEIVFPGQTEFTPVITIEVGNAVLTIAVTKVVQPLLSVIILFPVTPILLILRFPRILIQ